MQKRSLAHAGSTTTTRRAGWALVDQLLSSGSNALLPLVAIGRLGPADAGRLSVVLSTMLLAIGVSRGLVGESYVVYASREDADTTSELRRRMLGLAVVVGGVSGTAIGIFATLYLHSTLGGLLLGIGLLGVIVQDSARFSMFESGHIPAAALNDLVWLCAFAGIAFLTVRAPTAISLLLGWCWCGAACAVLALWQLSTRPRPAGALLLLHEKLSTSWKVATEFVLTAGVPQLLVAVVAIFGSLESGARYRLAITLVSPAGVVAGGMAAGLQPVAMRAESNQQLWRVVLATWMLSSVAIAACVGIVFAIPTNFGTSLLGPSFDSAKPLVLAMGVASVALAGCLSIGMAIRSKSLLSPSLVVRTLVGATTVVVAIPLVISHSAIGAATVFAGGSWTMLGGLSWVVVRSYRRPRLAASSGAPRL